MSDHYPSNQLGGGVEPLRVLDAPLVYLIEDEAGLRSDLSSILRDSNLEVLEFESAEAFLLKHSVHTPSVIVTDMVLPGMSGIKLFEVIRQANIETPVVFISGYSEPRQIIEAMKLGAVDFLWKPFKSDALLAVIMKSLDLDRQRTLHASKQKNLELRWYMLTPKEREVCKLMLDGLGNSAIADRLEIQPDTANKHRMKVLAKMDVRRRPELVELLKDFDLARNSK